MRVNWIARAFELLDTADGLFCHGDNKPLNTRTHKTVWKERRRRANLPRSIKRRVGAK